MYGVIWLRGISGSCKAQVTVLSLFFPSRARTFGRIYDACGVLAIRGDVETALTRRISASRERQL